MNDFNIFRQDFKNCFYGNIAWFIDHAIAVKYFRYSLENDVKPLLSHY